MKNIASQKKADGIRMHGRTLSALACSLMAAVLAIPSCGEKENKEEPSPIIQKDTRWAETGMGEKTYINNGIVQLGIDLDRGGGVFHFSNKKTKKNLLNHFDNGRLIQQSYYGEMDGTTWDGRAWRWNPVQGGGWQGPGAQVKEKDIQDEYLKVSSYPVHWASCESLKDECLMTEEIWLIDNYAKITYSFSNDGPKAKRHNERRDQELPAIFCDYNYNYLSFYDGDKPWTGGELTTVRPHYLNEKDNNGNTIPIDSFERTEEWAAYTDAKGSWGIGVYTPATTRMSAYLVQVQNAGPTGPSCSYFSPHDYMVINPGFKCSYDVYVTIGSLKEIRETFYKIHESLK